MLNKLFSFIKSKEQSQKETFEYILQIANNISQENPKELLNLIKLLGQKTQAEQLLYILKHKNGHHMRAISRRNIWFSPSTRFGIESKTLSEVFLQLPNNDKISLGDDLVITNPWERSRMQAALIHHGQSRNRGAWKQDSNHYTVLWKPLNIIWVENGNHSIAAGIIQGDGTLVPSETYDISPIYDYIKCDGNHFIDIEQNKVIGNVRNIEFAAIFEIGRLLRDVNK